MARVFNNAGDSYLVKTATGRTHVVQVTNYVFSPACMGMQTMTDLCRAIVQIEKSGGVVTGVYQKSTGKQVFYRNTDFYQQAKREACYGG